MKLTQQQLDTIRRILASSTDDFSELVGIAGLDPKRDFRHADLRGVAFRQADTSLFDFSHADLDGSDHPSLGRVSSILTSNAAPTKTQDDVEFSNIDEESSLILQLRTLRMLARTSSKHKRALISKLLAYARLKLKQRDFEFAQKTLLEAIIGCESLEKVDDRLSFKASTYAYLADALSGLTQHVAAVEAANQASECYRKLLAMASPQTSFGRSGLVTKIARHSMRLERLHENEEAISLGNLGLEMAIKSGDASLIGLAHFNLAKLLSAQGNKGDSIIDSEAGLAALRTLDKRPVHQGNLAGALIGHTSRLRYMGRISEAIATAREAAQIYGKLIALRPEQYMYAFVRSMTGLAKLLIGENQYTNAFETVLRGLEAMDAISVRPSADLASALEQLLKVYVRTCSELQIAEDNRLIRTLSDKFAIRVAKEASTL